MTFGFSTNSDDTDEDSEPEITHIYSDKLSYWAWKDLKKGLGVRSLVTGNHGKINRLEEKFFEVGIEWSHGGTSYAKHAIMKMVIVVE